MAETTIGLIAAHKTSARHRSNKRFADIRHAIYETGDDFRLVFVRGPRDAALRGDPEGGYGKTRLLEDVNRLLIDENKRVAIDNRSRRGGLPSD